MTKPTKDDTKELIRESLDLIVKKRCSASLLQDLALVVFADLLLDHAEGRQALTYLEKREIAVNILSKRMTRKEIIAQYLQIPKDRHKDWKDVSDEYWEACTKLTKEKYG